MSQTLVVLARILVVMLLAVLLASDAHATALLIAVSQNRILLATDGMSVHTRNGVDLTYSHHCKIEHVRESFLVVVGLEDYPDAGLNIPELARRALSGGDLSQQVRQFEKVANGPIIRTLTQIKEKDPILNALLSAAKGPAISVVLVSKIKESLAVAILEYTEGGGSFKENPPKISVGGSAPAYLEIGDVDAIDAYMQGRDMRGMDDISWFRTLLGVAINAQPAIGFRKVGAPISILEITNVGARWIEQGVCSSVSARPQSRKPV